MLIIHMQSTMHAASFPAIMQILSKLVMYVELTCGVTLTLERSSAVFYHLLGNENCEMRNIKY